MKKHISNQLDFLTSFHRMLDEEITIARHEHTDDLTITEMKKLRLHIKDRIEELNKNDSADRRVFHIDVGNMPPAQAKRCVDQIKKQLRDSQH